MRGTFIHVPVETAIRPVNGECMVGYWWSVDPAKGLTFYVTRLGGPDADDSPAPQCNLSEATCRQLAKRLHPDNEVIFLEVVYLTHAIKEMKRVREVVRAERLKAKENANV